MNQNRPYQGQPNQYPPNQNYPQYPGQQPNNYPNVKQTYIPDIAVQIGCIFTLIWSIPVCFFVTIFSLIILPLVLFDFFLITLIILSFKVLQGKASPTTKIILGILILPSLVPSILILVGEYKPKNYPFAPSAPFYNY
ncbi:hypothetical protein [Candidatus Phytoplasma australiense]|uniref:Uncharacterized protein n=1 Tax=Strawberry lethal yellows phytoplasma (CPA) str. NZSb11 TaxID=980422 RepID=R4S1T1_PHYAS|nr:hypothetical protein [Candidatus Phytoplasma australiense]AGL90779.1 Hypothetical Protein SLY_0864 [Strawberry lethal yellows phytoplasma (CPA) str. NZSb11]